MRSTRRSTRRSARRSTRRSASRSTKKSSNVKNNLMKNNKKGNWEKYVQAILKELKKHHKSATYKEAVGEATKRTEHFWKKSLHSDFSQ